MRLEHGFTLTELMVAILIAGILIVIAIPSYTVFVQNERQITQANNILFAINYARSEAVKRDALICLCPSADGATCANNWASGWIVHQPAAADCTVPSTTLQQSPAVTSPMTLTAYTGATAVTSIGYLGIGTAQANNAAMATNIQFRLCDTRGANKARDVEVTANGRAEASPTQGYTISGTALTCP